MTSSADAFAVAYDRGEPQLVVERMVADLETAVSAQMKLAELGGPIFLLESVEGGAVRGRYSMIGVKPDLIWRARTARPRSTAGARRPRGLRNRIRPAAREPAQDRGRIARAPA